VHYLGAEIYGRLFAYYSLKSYMDSLDRKINISGRSLYRAEIPHYVCFRDTWPYLLPNEKVTSDMSISSDGYGFNIDMSSF
jgi:hypothetical protein